MKIYFAHTRDSDYENELYKPIRHSVINERHEIIFPHEGGKHINSKEVIKSSDLMIAEVSYPATGSGIEIGWADMVGVPLWCVFKQGSKVSGSLKYVTDQFIEYVDAEDLISKLAERLG